MAEFGNPGGCFFQLSRRFSTTEKGITHMPPRRRAGSPSPTRPSASPARTSVARTKASPSPRKAAPKKDVAAAEELSADPAIEATESAAKSETPVPELKQQPQKTTSRRCTDAFAVATLVIVLGLATAPLILPESPEKAVPLLNYRAFAKSKLELKSKKEGYVGHSLIIFSKNLTTHSPLSSLAFYSIMSSVGMSSVFPTPPALASDVGCWELARTIQRRDFQRKHAAWHSRGTLRMGQVRCNEHRGLCERFRVIDAPDGYNIRGAAPAPGLPHILWFKGGRLMGNYEGERTVHGFTQFVLGLEEKELAEKR